LSDGTYRVTESDRPADESVFEGPRRRSVDVIDLAIDIDIQRVRSCFPNR